MRSPPERLLSSKPAQWAEDFVHGQSAGQSRDLRRWNFDEQHGMLEFELNKRAAHGRMVVAAFQLTLRELFMAGDHVRDLLARRIHKTRTLLRHNADTLLETEHRKRLRKEARRG